MSKPILIHPGSRWQYLGNPGYGFIHTVIKASQAEIITWSDTSRDSDNVGGWSWLGLPNDFVKQFAPIKAGPQ